MFRLEVTRNKRVRVHEIGRVLDKVHTAKFFPENSGNYWVLYQYRFNIEPIFSFFFLLKTMFYKFNVMLPNFMQGISQLLRLFLPVTMVRLWWGPKLLLRRNLRQRLQKCVCYKEGRRKPLVKVRLE